MIVRLSAPGRRHANTEVCCFVFFACLVSDQLKWTDIAVCADKEALFELFRLEHEHKYLTQNTGCSPTAFVVMQFPSRTGLLTTH